MEELSLHILDIVQNSIAANATLVEIYITEDAVSDQLTITVKDNGDGMSKEMQKAVEDPFTTSRKTRKVGLGIPLLKLAAELTGGEIKISSKEGEGTTIFAKFSLSHIDRQPLGDMASTIHQLIIMNEDTDFIYSHQVNKKDFRLDTKEVKEILGGVSVKEHAVMVWLLDYLKEGENELNITDGKE